MKKNLQAAVAADSFCMICRRRAITQKSNYTERHREGTERHRGTVRDQVRGTEREVYMHG